VTSSDTGDVSRHRTTNTSMFFLVTFTQPIYMLWSLRQVIHTKQTLYYLE